MANIEIIQTRWAAGRKLSGACNVLTLADGGTLAGVYYLAEAGTATPSHNALNGFVPSEGFPTDENGHSVNDRDYQKDGDAQQITRDIASHYDARAIQNVVIVSPHGVVLSGNGRTMAGELAARDNTDGAYIDHLRTYGSAYGFTPSQVDSFSHPRLLFVTADALPYTASTFARFNAKEMKSQSKTEQAVKFGKLVDDATFGRITATINAFDTLGDFYANTEAATRCLNDLRTAGVIDAMSYAELFDGDTISAAGRELLENVLIGKAFAVDPDAARKITTYKSLRKSVVFALAEIANNIGLGNGYTLNFELSEAINLAYIARQHGYKAGEKVSMYSRQLDAFSGDTVCDCKDTIILVLADALNDERATMLKRLLSVYNHQAADAANGQTDMFSAGSVRTKAEILDDVKAIFATGTAKEQKQAEKTATEARTAQNIFVSEQQATIIAKGGYVEFKTASGDVIVCEVEAVKGMFVSLLAKGGIKFRVSRQQLTPTADHRKCLPEWLVAGSILTDGKSVSQKVAEICEGMVIFEWINGGVFAVSVAEVLKNWKPSEHGVCIFEAA